MAYCKNCGAELDEKAVICPSCGVLQRVVPEGNLVLYGIVGLLMPMVGLILFFLWYDTKPKTAKTTAICAVITFCILNLISIM